jgi:hypothetical protein
MSSTNVAAARNTLNLFPTHVMILAIQLLLLTSLEGKV